MMTLSDIVIKIVLIKQALDNAFFPDCTLSLIFKQYNDIPFLPVGIWVTKLFSGGHLNCQFVLLGMAFISWKEK